MPRTGSDFSFPRRDSSANARQGGSSGVKIIVCLKQVPARDAPLKINSAGNWIEAKDIGYEVNEPDIYALEEALRLKEKHSGEVVSGRPQPDGCAARRPQQF